MTGDIEVAEAFLREIAHNRGQTKAKYMWEQIKHRYPNLRWDSEKLEFVRRDNEDHKTS